VSDAGRLAGFGLVLAAALGLGFTAGALVGPVDTVRAPVVVPVNDGPAPGGSGMTDTETGR